MRQGSGLRFEAQIGALAEGGGHHRAPDMLSVEATSRSYGKTLFADLTLFDHGTLDEQFGHIGVQTVSLGQRVGR